MPTVFQDARCPNSKNPYHRCTAYCIQKIHLQDDLYGAATPSPGQHETNGGKTSTLQPIKVAGATSICRVEEINLEEVMMEYLDGDGKPLIVTNSQESWKARTLWSFGYLREHYGEEHVLCSDK
ncbi:hypothetical protein CYMTET_13801, partial [Cymbomonas tetramitiformis]